MANPAWTFEGTSVADLQAIHDNLVAFLKGGKVAAGMAAYTVFGRTVSSIPLTELVNLVSALSNEIARKGLPQSAANDVYDVTFDDGSGSSPIRRSGW